VDFGQEGRIADHSAETTLLAHPSRSHKTAGDPRFPSIFRGR
jgi:hypothetical protein